jgi:hypothetical protein
LCEVTEAGQCGCAGDSPQDFVDYVSANADLLADLGVVDGFLMALQYRQCECERGGGGRPPARLLQSCQLVVGGAGFALGGLGVSCQEVVTTLPRSNDRRASEFLLGGHVR